MNKSERNGLALSCAEMVYGRDGDESSSSWGRSIVGKFPAIKADFDNWAYFCGIERIACKYAQYCVAEYRVKFFLESQINSDCLFKVADEVESILMDWFEGADYNPQEFIEQSIDFSVLPGCENFKALCKQYHENGIISKDALCLLTIDKDQ